MEKFGVEDDQQLDQGDYCFMSDDDDDYLDAQSSDQDEDGFMSDDDDYLDAQSSDQEDDDGSAMSDDADSPLDEQPDQEEDDGYFVDPDPDRQADLIAAFLRGVLRSDTERGFYTPAGASGEDGPAGTFSGYDVIHLTGRRSPAEDYAAAEDDDDDEDEDEDDPFPVHEPSAAAEDGAGGEGGPAVGTFSERYYVFDFPGRRAAQCFRIRRFPAPEGYPATEDYAAAEDEDDDDPFPVQEPPSAAASEAAVVALEAAEAPADDCCPVCLQDGVAAPGDAWKRVAPCGHLFHAACVAQCLRVKLSCPVCRCRAAAAPTAPRRDDAAEEPSRSRPLPIPDIVEEMLSMSNEESDVFEKTSRWIEFMATRNLP